MPPRNPTPPIKSPLAAADVPTKLDLLEKILRAQIEIHHRLLDFIERKREAIRTADLSQIESLCQQENVVAQKLAALEKHRLDLVGQLTMVFQPKAERPLTMTDIAMRLAEPQQSRLTALAAQLREDLTKVKQQSSIVRAAAETLARHMSGIMQSVNSALSKARVYGQRGRLVVGAQVQSIVDFKS